MYLVRAAVVAATVHRVAEQSSILENTAEYVMPHAQAFFSFATGRGDMVQYMMVGQGQQTKTCLLLLSHRDAVIDWCHRL